MNDFEEVTLEVGVWRPNTEDRIRIDKVTFNGRRLAEAVSSYGYTSTGDDVGTNWKLYQRDDGKFVLWWRDWTKYQDRPNVADYVVLDKLPRKWRFYYGLTWDMASRYVPEVLVEQAEAALNIKGEDTTEDYEEWKLTVGVLFKNEAGHIDQVRFKGRLLADGVEVYGETEDGAIRETDWEIYQTDDGKFIVYWWHWSSVWFDPSISDYAIVDNFPTYGEGFTGKFLGGPVWEMPYHILDRAKAVLEGKEDYRPGI